MKKFSIFLSCGIGGLVGICSFFGMGSLVSQQLQHEVTVINIEVPVRVFDGDRFVEGLTLKDFEVYEDGVPQKVEAVYLVRKTTVLRNVGVAEGPASVIKPENNVNNRHFILVFEMDEYFPQLGKAIDMFFSDVLTPTDTLRVIAPGDSWQMKKESLDKASRTALAEQLKSKLRKALTLGGAPLKSLLEDLRFYTNTNNPNTMAAMDTIEQIVNLKTINVPQYEEFARILKPLEGQKYVIIFYEQESYVIPFYLKELFEKSSQHRTDTIDRKEIRKIFSDAGTTVHFLFLKKSLSPDLDVEYQDQGSAAVADMPTNFYQVFRELAITTGGISESTANPVFAFKRALEASENFYLVYYKPAAYRADGKFKEIEVKVKGGRYQVTHRAGYIEK